MGRPTKYNPEMLQEASDYIFNYQNHGDMMPSVVGLAVVLDVDRTTIYEWGDKHDEFSLILGKLQTAQERVLFNKGLSGDFNAAITKLALGKHGYHDKADTTISGPDGGPVQQDIQVEFVGVPE